MRCPVLFSMWEGRSGAACLGTRRRMLGCMPAAGVRKGKIRRPPSARRGKIRRLECEDFAPRNGATRVRGEGGAKRGGAGRAEGQNPAAGM